MTVKEAGILPKTSAYNEANFWQEQNQSVS
jgi:hypothetical protein